MLFRSAVLHLAAESHVDRSIDGPAAFVRTNLVGTFTMLDEATRYWRGLSGAKRSSSRQFTYRPPTPPKDSAKATPTARPGAADTLAKKRP